MPQGYRPPSAGTAQTMILVGLILEVLFGVLFLADGALGLAFASSNALGSAFYVFPLIWLVAFGVLPLFLVLFAYQRSYLRTREGQYEAARDPTLLIAIIELIFGVLPGIFYLIGYIKLGDAISEARQPPVFQAGYMPGMPQPGYAMPGAAPGAAYPPYAASPAPAPVAAPLPAAVPAAPSCPRCQRPGTWIPQYGRYYCYTCAQYL